MTDRNDNIDMTEQNMVGKLMDTLIEQIKVLEKPWNQCSEEIQQEALDRMHPQIKGAVEDAVNLIACMEFAKVLMLVDQVVFKDGAKVVLKSPTSSEGIHQIADHQGKTVFVVIDPSENMTESEEGIPKAEPDQRSMQLGHEYDPAEPEGGLSDDELDEQYEKAVELADEEDSLQIGVLQRKLRIGYKRAAQIIEAMEDNGVLGEFDGHTHPCLLENPEREARKAMYEKVVAFVLEHKKASVAAIVSEFDRMNRTKAEEFLQIMEKAGLVTAKAGNGQRQVKARDTE